MICQTQQSREKVLIRGCEKMFSLFLNWSCLGPASPRFARNFSLLGPYTQIGWSGCYKLRECHRQVETEEVSKSRNLTIPGASTLTNLCMDQVAYIRKIPDFTLKPRYLGGYSNLQPFLTLDYKHHSIPSISCTVYFGRFSPTKSWILFTLFVC